jgi:DNA polymerase III alpha subunit (gram-positive type)
MARELIFVDTETTGFEDDPNAEMWELSWARRDGVSRTLWFGFTEVPAFIDELTGFTSRNCAGKRSEYFEFEEFLKASKDATMVCANPSFDKHFIKLAGLWQFHYRTLDIESYAMAKLQLDEVPGMKGISDILAPNLPNLVLPDHSSRNDVLALRECYLFLEDM